MRWSSALACFLLLGVLLPAVSFAQEAQLQQPTITSSPDDPTNSTSASFSFTGEPGATFECQLDGGGFVACPSGYNHPSPLGAGSHTFQVHEIDTAGDSGPNASYTWTIDLSAPTAPNITSKPADPTKSTSASFSFTGEAGATFECQLDGGDFSACTEYNNLGDGSHTFRVHQTDTAGNIGPNASHTWTVDTKPATAVLRLRSQFGNHWIKLLWEKPTDVDYDHVTISRRRVGSANWTLLGTRSAGTTFLDKPVPNDVRFEYAVRTFDTAGNISSVRKVGRASRILSPRYGAVVGPPPLVDWTPTSRATYYNMQLWRNGRKILSVWPDRSSYRLRAGWTFGGQDYALRQGSYRVYVWPGFGRKSAANYGGLLGWTSFTVG